MWHNKRIYSHGLKITSCCCFFGFEETKFEVNTTSIILSYLYNFENIDKESFRYCLSSACQTIQAKRHMTKLIRFTSNFLSWKTLEGSEIQIALQLTKILQCFWTNGCRKWRNRSKIEKFVVLAEYLEEQKDFSRYRRKISLSRRSSSWRNQAYLPFLVKQVDTRTRSYQQSTTQSQNGAEKVLLILLKL